MSNKNQKSKKKKLRLLTTLIFSLSIALSTYFFFGRELSLKNYSVSEFYTFTNNHLTNNEEIQLFYSQVILNKYKLNTYKFVQDSTGSKIVFYKSVSPNLFQRAFMRITRFEYYGELYISYNKEISRSEIELRIEWRKFLNNDKYELVKPNHFKIGFTSANLIETLTSWEINPPTTSDT